MGHVEQRAMTRADLLTRLAELIVARRPAHTLRVAIDGPDTAGKSTLAAELGGRLAGVRETILASVDGFHRPRRLRYRRGSLSPEGYYEDSFDHDALVLSLLRPLGPGGSGHYRTAVFDHRGDTERVEPTRHAGEGAVLLFDGIFLLRPGLRDFWDLSIYLEVSPDVAVRRALTRDVELFGTVETVRERYRRRYLPAQRLYRAEASPTVRADVVIDNDDPLRPGLRRWPSGPARVTRRRTRPEGCGGCAGAVSGYAPAFDIGRRGWPTRRRTTSSQRAGWCSPIC
ncbi:uridylate kinase [Micromonospora sp. CA-263727]|uniref:uridylate kinase n=1 Tax=Micromonospora sp. CA-263727 TaxID=3239967 RepID=UPI003D948708